MGFSSSTAEKQKCKTWIEILFVSNNNAKLTWLGVAFFSPTWRMKVNARYIFFFAVASKKKVSVR
jgi:hypothetical protein